MGDQTYGNTWSIYPINWRNLTILRDQRQQVLDANQYLNQAIYILLLALAAYHFLDYRLPAPAVSAMAIFSVILLILPHTILEVQSRYHHIILPYIVLVAGQGLLELVGRRHEFPDRYQPTEFAGNRQGRLTTDQASRGYRPDRRRSGCGAQNRSRNCGGTQRLAG